MPEFFHDFFTALPAGRYCVTCLAAFYGQPVEMIRNALAHMASSVEAVVARCANCDRTTRTFKRLM
jgi:hypothetical protein